MIKAAPSPGERLPRLLPPDYHILSLGVVIEEFEAKVSEDLSVEVLAPGIGEQGVAYGLTGICEMLRSVIQVNEPCDISYDSAVPIQYAA